MSSDMNDDPFNDEYNDDEFDHERLLEQLAIGLLRQADLADLCEGADLPVLLDAAGRPVTLTKARGYRDAGVLTLDRGTWLEFSDGAVYGLTVSVSHRPTEPGSTRPARRQHPTAAALTRGIRTPILTMPPRGTHSPTRAVPSASQQACWVAESIRPG